MNGTDLHDHLTRVTAEVGAERPRMRALRATADSSRVRNQRIGAGAAVAVLAVAGAAVATVRSRGGNDVQTASSPASTGLPGLVADGSVTLPAGLTPLQVERSGDLVWAVADDRSDETVILRGRVGQELVPQDLGGVDTVGSDATIALAGGRAYIALSSGATTTGRPREPYLDERNAATGADEVGWGLVGTQDPSHHDFDADGIALVPTDDGAPVLAITSHSGGRQLLRVAVLDPAASPLRDLLSTQVTPAVAVPGDQLLVGTDTPSFSGLTLVTTAHGLPTYAYLTGTLDTVPILDLETGAVTTYRTGAHLPDSGGGMGAGVAGTIGGQVVFDVEGDDHDDHAELAAPGGLAPTAIGPDGGGAVVAGRIFRTQGEASQQLSTTTLRPTGPQTSSSDELDESHGRYEVDIRANLRTLLFYAAP
jgi:hypothetical protein